MTNDEAIFEVCDAISVAATTADAELRSYPTIRKAVTVPAIVVTPADPFLDYHASFDGTAFEAFFDVVFVASQVNEVEAQRRVYRWLNPRNAVWQAIDAIAGVTVTQAVNVGGYEVGDATYWGATLRVTYAGLLDADPGFGG